jgi:hypothetical protein
MLYLASQDALVQFLQYFRIFGPGHAAAGAIPYTSAGWFGLSVFGLGIVLVLATWVAVAVRLARQSPWTTHDWVIVAAAGFCALYGQKPLGRFDQAHVFQGFTSTLPLLVLWIGWFLRYLEVWHRRRSTAPDDGDRRAGARLGVPRQAQVFVVVVLALPALLLPAAWWHAPERLHASAESEGSIAKLGYIDPRYQEAQLVEHLSTVLDRYAGRSGPVFDMTNSLGYVYYLLGRTPGTRFVHVSMAIPEYAQRLLVEELRRSRPSLVLLDSSTTGLPGWDGISNTVRHFMVSQYVLDGWVPLVRVDGVLVMLRRDLAASDVGPAGRANRRALYSGSVQACDWGYVPAFLTVSPGAAPVRLHVEPVGRRRSVRVSGWAVSQKADNPVVRAVLVSSRRVVAELPMTVSRRNLLDRAGVVPLLNGFYERDVLLNTRRGVSVYAQTRDGRLHRLGSPGTRAPAGVRVEGLGGDRLKLGSTVRGRVEQLQGTGPRQVGRVEAPAGTALDEYAVLSVDARTIGARSSLVLSDSLRATKTQEVRLRTMPTADRLASIRVDSCLQWHGYDGRTLYVSQTGGRPLDEIWLSRRP